MANDTPMIDRSEEPPALPPASIGVQHVLDLIGRRMEGDEVDARTLVPEETPEELDRWVDWAMGQAARSGQGEPGDGPA
jgi:hypothetical protein